MGEVKELKTKEEQAFDAIWLSTTYQEVEHIPSSCITILEDADVIIRPFHIQRRYGAILSTNVGESDDKCWRILGVHTRIGPVYIVEINTNDGSNQRPISRIPHSRNPERKGDRPSRYRLIAPAAIMALPHDPQNLTEYEILALQPGRVFDLTQLMFQTIKLQELQDNVAEIADTDLTEGYSTALTKLTHPAWHDKRDQFREFP